MSPLPFVPLLHGRRSFSTVVDLAHLSTPLMDPTHLSSLPPTSSLLSSYTVSPPIHLWPRNLTHGRLTHLIRSQTDPHLALRIFLHAAHFHAPSKFSPSYPSFLATVEHLARNRIFDPIPSLLSLLKKSHTKCGEEIFITLIRAYSAASRPSLSLRCFLSIPTFHVQTSVRAFNALLNAMINNRRYHLVHLLFKNCRTKFAIRPNVFTCNILLKALCKMGDVDSALKVLDEMPQSGITPNVVTYTTIIAYYCARGDLATAKTTLDDLRNRGFKPDVTTYTVLVDGYCRAGRFDDAVKVMDDMESNRVSPNDVTYSVMIEALSKEGKSGEALSLLEDMLDSKYVPSSSLCCKVIDTLCQNGKVEDASEIWRKLLKKNVTPDNSITSTLIYWLCKVAKVSEARKLFDEFERGFIPGMLTYNTLISGMCENGELQEAGRLWDDMVGKRCRPNDFTYNVLIKGFCKAGKAKEGIKVLEEMLGKGFVPNKSTCRDLVDGLSCCAKEEDDIELPRNVVSRIGEILDEDSWDVLVRKVLNGTHSWKDALCMMLTTGATTTTPKTTEPMTTTTKTKTKRATKKTTSTARTRPLSKIFACS